MRHWIENQEFAPKNTVRTVGVQVLACFQALPRFQAKGNSLKAELQRFPRILGVYSVISCCLVFSGIGQRVHAQESATQPHQSSELKSNANDRPSRQQRIARYLTGAVFTGQFTVDGKSKAKSESYTISSCEPIQGEDLYRLKVKIRYADVDGEFPIDLKILWAGSTPVITLDAVWIPGLGTFSSRVLIHQDRYSGTWQHDEKGGHLFGIITPASDE